MTKTATLDSSISRDQFLAKLAMFGARGRSLCGKTADGRPLGEATEQFFKDLSASMTDPEKVKANDALRAAALNDPRIRQQLAGIRMDVFNNYIYATNNIMSMFFEVQNLGMEENPVIQNQTMQEVSINTIGADGGVKMSKVTPDYDELILTLRYLTTDKMRYRRVDINRGQIIDTAIKTLEMSYDMKNQMDARCYTLLTTAAGSGAATQVTGAFGAFRYFKDGNTALKRSQYTYLPNSRIVIGNLPTTNDIVLGDNSSSTSFRYGCLLEAARYFSRWNGAFPQGDLIPTGRVLVPGADAADFASQITPQGNTNNPVANELLTKGWLSIPYLGMTWNVIADNTLPPGYCYFEANRKPGKVYLKPSLDKENVWGENDYNLSQNNEEERWSQKVFGAYINSATRMNILRIKYRS